MTSKEVVLNETDMVVMKVLLGNAYVLPSKTASIKDVMELLNKANIPNTLPESTLYRSIKKLLEANYLKEGLKSGRTRKFHVTAQGAEKYSGYVNTPIEEKEKLLLAYEKATIPDNVPEWANLYEEVQKHYYSNEKEN